MKKKLVENWSFSLVLTVSVKDSICCREIGGEIEKFCIGKSNHENMQGVSIVQLQARVLFIDAIVLECTIS